MKRFVATMAALTTLCVSSSAVAQDLIPPGPRAPYEVRQTGSFGYSEFRPRSGMDSLTLRAGGDMFGRVTELVMSRDGRTLYVLDNMARKVVALKENGTVRVVLTWRDGQGPGEMTRARGLAVTPTGFAIGDMSQPRVSFFTLQGKFDRAAMFPGDVLRLVPTPTGYAGMRTVIREGKPQVLLLNHAGTIVDSMLPMKGRLADFTQYGEPGGFMLDGVGEAWFVSPAPGLLCTLSHQPRCSGTDLFPEVRGSIVKINGREGRSVPLGVRGAAQLATGEIVILLWTYREEVKTWLLVFSKEMKYQGYIDMPGVAVRELARGFRANEVVVAADEPYPRVIRYQIRRRQ